MPLKIAINGFGRIGRCAFKIANSNPEIQVVAINDLSPASVLAHLLKYDSVYGMYELQVEVERGGKLLGREGELSADGHFSAGNTSEEKSFLIVGGKRVALIAEKDPAKLPWKEFGVDVVLECTGRFTKLEDAMSHIRAGAKKVVISAPTKGEGGEMFLLGVNEDAYKGEGILSNASCTTNCIAPVAKVIENEFGILKAAMTTIHAYTAEQNLVDGLPPALHPDLRRARSAGVNIVPTTTGAAKSLGAIISSLSGIFDGMAIRVPVVCGSLSDFTILTKKKVTKEEVNDVFISASKSKALKGILGVSFEPLVSTDIIKSPYSSIVDLTLTKVIDGDFLKVVAWYDNEWGYSCRLVELAEKIGKFK